MNRAPVGYTCPDINAVIEQLAGVADQLDALASHLEDDAITTDLNDNAQTLRALFTGRWSPLEELRTDNERLRTFGEKESERAEEAEAEARRLQERIDELEAERI